MTWKPSFGKRSGQLAMHDESTREVAPHDLLYEKMAKNWEHFFEVQEIYNFKMRLEQKVVFQAPFLQVLVFFLQDTF